jgi:hypothetical protein
MVIRWISDTWVGAESEVVVSFESLVMPEYAGDHTPRLDRLPLLHPNAIRNRSGTKRVRGEGVQVQCHPVPGPLVAVTYQTSFAHMRTHWMWEVYHDTDIGDVSYELSDGRIALGWMFLMAQEDPPRKPRRMGAHDQSTEKSCSRSRG